MLKFMEWLITEVAIGPQNVQYDDQGRPNFRVSIRNGGQIIGLEMLQGSSYKYSETQETRNNASNISIQ